MKKLLLLLCVFLLSGRMSSQVKTPCDSSTVAKEGTFEIVKKNKTEAMVMPKEVLPLEILCLIEKSRMDTENVTLYFENYNVVVYPRIKKK